MPKPRESGRPGRPQTASSRSSTPPQPRPGGLDFRRHGGWVAAAFGVAWLAYLALFYSDTELLRFRSLGYVVAPELLLEIWTGGEPHRVGVFDRLPVFAVAGCVIVAGYLLGHALLIPLSLRRWTNRAERFVLRSGAGMNALSLFTLAVGLAGALHALTFVAVAVLAALVTGWDLWQSRSSYGHAAGEQRGGEQGRDEQVGGEQVGGEQVGGGATRRRFPVWGWLFVLPFAAAYLWVATQAPWEFDVREYHLQIPKEWYQAGRVDFVDHNVYGNMPLGAEMHALLSMIWMPGEDAWWYGAIAGKVVIAWFSLLTAGALYVAGCRFLHASAGLAAAVLYLSVPWLFHVSTVGLIEGVYAFYFWSAVYCFMRWHTLGAAAANGGASGGASDDPARGPWSLSPPTVALLLAGFFAGAAAACKYTAVVFVLFPLTLWLLGVGIARLVRRRGTPPSESPSEPASEPLPQSTLHPTVGWPEAWRRAFLPLLLFGAAAAAGGGLWYAKNLALTGNPVFPLAYSVFGGRGWDSETDQQWTQAHAVPRDAEGRRYPLYKAFASMRRLFWRSDWLSPILVPFFLLGLLVAGSRYFGLPSETRRRVAALAGLWAVVLVLWWLLTHRFDRFLIPILPMVALVGAVGAGWSTDRGWLYTSRVILGIGCLLSFLTMVSGLTGGDRRFLHALEEQRVEQPVVAGDEAYFIRTHPAYRLLNEIVPDGYRVLMVGDAQVFDLEPPVLYNTCFDDCWFELLMKGRTVDERRAALRENRISHVFVHWDEIRRYRSPGNYGYTDYVQPGIFAELVRQGILRPLPVEVGGVRLRPTSGQVFEVVGFRQPT